MILRFALFVFVFAFAAVHAPAADYVSVRGSVVVARVMEMVAAEIARDLDVEFRAATDSSTAESIYLVGNGVVELAIASRMMTPEERASRPDKTFQETVIGYQALVVIVSDELWRAGVKALTQDQLRAIYENELRNWKAVGGPDREIGYFNRESTYGVWDLYMLYLFGDVRKASLSKAEVINNAEEASTAVQFSSGSYSVIEFGAYKEGKGVRALGLRQPDGSIVEPTLANIVNGKYGIVRPLVLITSKQATGKLRQMIEFMAGPKGQAAVRKAGNITVTDYEAEKAKK